MNLCTYGQQCGRSHAPSCRRYSCCLDHLQGQRGVNISQEDLRTDPPQNQIAKLCLTEEENKVHRDGLGEGLLVKRGRGGVVNGNNKQKLKN